MRVTLVCMLLWLVCIIGFSSCRADVIYVSSTFGSDENDGLTINTPIKTIGKALSLGDTILLRGGDIFYESVTIRNGMLGRYGKGQNPIICGYKRIINPNWEHVDTNIWRLPLVDNNFSGFIVKGSAFQNNIGCIHEYDTDSIHGRRVRFKRELNENWDFWQTEHHSHKEVEGKDFDTVYVYLKQDPNKFKLEFSIADAAVRISNATIERIKMEGFGFGISAGTHTTIRNCELDAIGGMMAINDNYFTSYGNGIEFWISKNTEECMVENCTISRCYDCGVTIQGSGGGQAKPRNIIIRNNFIERCSQGWEDFLRNDSNVVYENCVFENNIVVNSGKTSGFSYPDSRFKYCHVLGNNTEGDKGMIIRNNTFVGGNYYCSGAYNGKYKSNKWQGNTCVIKRGDFLLGNYMGTKDVIRVPVEKGEFPTLKAATNDAISRYRELTGDMTTKFVIKDSVAIDKQIIKLKKKYLKK